METVNHPCASVACRYHFCHSVKKASRRFVSAAMLSTDSCSLVTLLLSASEGADAGSGTEKIRDGAALRERGDVKLRFKAGEQPFSVPPIQHMQGRWRKLGFR